MKHSLSQGLMEDAEHTSAAAVEQTQDQRRTEAYAAAPSCLGRGGGVALCVINGYVATGVPPVYIGMAILATDSQPSWADKMKVPWMMWIVESVVLCCCVLGFIAGLAHMYWDGASCRRWLTIQGIVNPIAAFVAIALLISAMSLFPSTAFAKDQEWTVPVCMVFCVYSMAGYAVWAAVSIDGFRARNAVAASEAVAAEECNDRGDGSSSPLA